MAACLPEATAWTTLLMSFVRSPPQASAGPSVPGHEGAMRQRKGSRACRRRVVPSLGGLGTGCLEQAVHDDLDRSVPVGLHAAAAAFLAGDFHLPQRDDAAPAVFFDPGRCDKFRQLHPFVEGHLDLVAEGGHVLAAPAIENQGLAAEPDDAARHVDGRVAAADDGGDPRDGRLLAVADFFEELEPVAARLPVSSPGTRSAVVLAWPQAR